MVKRISRYLAFVFLFLIAALGGLFLCKEQVLQYAVNHWAQPYDVQLTQVNGLDIGWQQVRLADAEVLYQQQPQSISGLTLKFSNNFTSIDSIEIDAMSVALLQSSAAHTESNASIQLTELAQNWQRLPEFTLLINQLSMGEQQARVRFVHGAQKDSLTLQSDSMFLEATTGWQGEALQGNYVFTFKGSKAVAGAFFLSQEDEQLQLNTNQSIDLKTFYASVSNLSVAALKIPEQLKSVNGELSATFDAAISPKTLTLDEAKLNLTAEQPLSAMVEVNNEIEANITFELSKGMELVMADGDITLAAEAMKLQENHFALNATIAELECGNINTCKAVIAFDAQPERIDLATLGQIQSRADANLKGALNGLKLQFSGDVKLANEQLEIRQRKTASIQLKEGGIGNFAFEGIDMDFGGLVLSTNLSSLKRQLILKEGELEMDKLAQDGKSLSGKLKYSELITDFKDNFKTKLSVSDVSVLHYIGWLPKFDFDGRLQLTKGNDVALSGNIVGESELILVSVALEHGLSQASGKGSFAINSWQFEGKSKGLEHYLSEWPYEIYLRKGQIDATADLSWNIDQQLQLVGQVQVQGRELGGIYKDIGFLGGELTSSFNVSELGIVSADMAALDVGLVDVGLPVTDIHLAAKVNSINNSAQVQTLSANLLGGSLEINDVNYRLGQSSNVEMLVNSLQLSELLALVDNKTIEGKGSISGVLPLTVSDDGITMAQGALDADGTGFIKYDSGEAIESAADPAVAVVNQALSNYHFETLSSSAEYDENGELVLAMRLEGQNPDMNGGQKINLNLNVQNNIPTMFKSLKLGREITDVIESKVNQ